MSISRRGLLAGIFAAGVAPVFIPTGLMKIHVPRQTIELVEFKLIRPVPHSPADFDSDKINFNTFVWYPELTRIDSRVVERPTKEQLLKDIEIMPLTSVGKQYGVSDNSIRKWCKAADIPLPNREPGYWTKKKFGLV